MKLRSKFKCLDSNQVSLYGSYHSTNARQIVLDLELCDWEADEGKAESDKKCDPIMKDSIARENYLKDKYLAYLFNEKRFTYVTNNSYFADAEDEHI